MRILFVSWRDLAHHNAGGSEVVVDHLARGLQARGHDVALLCGGPVGDRPYEVIANGGTYSQYAAAPARYARHHRDADLVVDVANGVPFFSPLWRRQPRLCLFHHVHGTQWQQYFSPAMARVGERIERSAIPRLYRHTPFLAISPSTREGLIELGVPADRIHLMHNGLELADVGDQPRSLAPLFLSLGRLAPNKRIDLLLEQWERVHPRTGGTLVLAGDGPDHDRIAARTAHLDHVQVLGRIDDRRKAELLQEAWLLVHTSDHEGWGLVMMEAAASGTTSLAYDVPGVRDAVIHDETGVLATDDDDFVQQWIRLAEDATERERLAVAAEHRAREFTWDGAVDDFLKAADVAIAEHQSTREPGSLATGLTRSARLLKLFRDEPSQPDPFYRFLAADTVEQLRPHLDLEGARAVDIGGGPGYTAEALKAEGASCIVVEYSQRELELHERSPDVAVQGDGQALPVATGSVELAHSSNVLEHVPNPTAMLAEMARVLDPATGVGYLTFTNWYSPWGGHETSPWHYLGGERAVRRYEKHVGSRPKNEFGVSLFPLHIREVLAWFDQRPDLEIVWVGPRYLPTWTRAIVRVPALRELLTWNLVVVFRHRAGAARPSASWGRSEAAA